MLNVINFLVIMVPRITMLLVYCIGASIGIENLRYSKGDIYLPTLFKFEMCGKGLTWLPVSTEDQKVEEDESQRQRRGTGYDEEHCRCKKMYISSKKATTRGAPDLPPCVLGSQNNAQVARVAPGQPYLFAEDRGSSPMFLSSDRFPENIQHGERRGILDSLFSATKRPKPMPGYLLIERGLRNNKHGGNFGDHTLQNMQPYMNCERVSSTGFQPSQQPKYGERNAQWQQSMQPIRQRPPGLQYANKHLFQMGGKPPHERLFIKELEIVRSDSTITPYSFRFRPKIAKFQPQLGTSQRSMASTIEPMYPEMTTMTTVPSLMSRQASFKPTPMTTRRTLLSTSENPTTLIQPSSIAHWYFNQLQEGQPKDTSSPTVQIIPFKIETSKIMASELCNQQDNFQTTIPTLQMSRYRELNYSGQEQSAQVLVVHIPMSFKEVPVLLLKDSQNPSVSVSLLLPNGIVRNQNNPRTTTSFNLIQIPNNEQVGIHDPNPEEDGMSKVSLRPASDDGEVYQQDGWHEVGAGDYNFDGGYREEPCPAFINSLPEIIPRIESCLREFGTQESLETNSFDECPPEEESAATTANFAIKDFQISPNSKEAEAPQASKEVLKRNKDDMLEEMIDLLYRLHDLKRRYHLDETEQLPE